MPHINNVKRQEYQRQYREKHKEFIKKKRHEWESKNREKLKEYHKNYNKKWYENNKEKRKKQICEYSKTHREDNVKRVQRYAKKHKEKVCLYNQKYNQATSGLYRQYKSRAKKRNMDFKLSLEEFECIINQPCSYCGETQNRRGIDRIDNSCGYTLGNSQSACVVCNYMKRTMTDDYFKKHISQIHRYLKL